MDREHNLQRQACCCYYCTGRSYGLRTQPTRTSLLLLLMLLHREELWIENTTYKDKYVVVIDVVA